ncbi:MAG: hypothetical protein M3014_13545 [Chloroflexota bacterium]|nr:hypothetical protein [Chloroflexota bacterium]
MVRDEAAFYLLEEWNRLLLNSRTAIIFGSFDWNTIWWPHFSPLSFLVNMRWSGYVKGFAPCGRPAAMPGARYVQHRAGLR